MHRLPTAKSAKEVFDDCPKDYNCWEFGWRDPPERDSRTLAREERRQSLRDRNQERNRVDGL